MSVECNEDGGNATDPAPAIAPGAEAIDAMHAAEAAARRGMDPRLSALVPAFDAPFFQAGLCGYSDAAMRIIARRHGCPFCVTEALLDRTILAGGRGFAKADLGEIEDNVPGGEDDHPLAGQLMGSDPREMAAAALKMIEQGARPAKEYRQLAYTAPGVHPSTSVGSPANGSASPPHPGSLRIHLRLPGGEQIGWYDPIEHLDDAPSFGAGAAPALPATLPHGRVSDSTFRTFATLDVNLACPVKKIDRKARGGHWLAEPDGAVAILEAVREAVPAHIPCTVKLRRAYDDTPDMAAAFERLLDAAFRIGYGWATVHARTVRQRYVGPSRWDILRDIVRRHPDKLILGSGDVWEAADIFRMVEYTGVAAAAVARGCIGNPWLFRQARRMMAGEPPAPPTLQEQRAVLEEHFALALRVNGVPRPFPGSGGNGRAGAPQSPDRATDRATGHAPTPSTSSTPPTRVAGALLTVPSSGTRVSRAEAFTARAMRKFGLRFARFHPDAESVRRRFIAVNSLAEWRAVLNDCYGAPTHDQPRQSPGVVVAQSIH